MIVAGLDEVGRGSIAGPLLVVAAAFEIEAWECSCPIPGVKDSKAFSSRGARSKVFDLVEAYSSFKGKGRGAVSSSDITTWGMGKALNVAFLRATETLPCVPDLLLVDGSTLVSGWPGVQTCRLKADVVWWPVSAASILAKVERDHWMMELSKTYPGYGLEQNMGYGTPAHFDAIRRLGITPVHRSNFITSKVFAQ